MLEKANKYLEIIHDRGTRKLPLERVYHGLRNRELFIMAYMNIYANDGAMTEGTKPEDTIDGMSLERIDNLVKALGEGTFKWTPVRRVYIPKKNGKLRPLGVPNWSDKLVQEAMRLILDTYYDPQFSDLSHGFRSNKGCHTALMHIQRNWKGAAWFIEGDIKGCFDNISHEILLKIMARNIHDDRFLKLVRDMLNAGYMENWKYNKTHSGTPQGGIISPLLSNIFLNELDKYVEDELIPKWTKGERRKQPKDYISICHRITYLRRVGKERELTENEKNELRDKGVEMRKMPSVDFMDTDYRRLKYIRYADDFLLAFSGTITEAKEIKEALKTFLIEELGLEMSVEKTLVTHARSEYARFLGYNIGISYENTKRAEALNKRSINGNPRLAVPRETIQEWIGQYTRYGKPYQRNSFLDYTDYEIVTAYEQEMMGLVNYYQLAQNVHALGKLRWVMMESLVMTLATKHKTHKSSIYKKHSFSPEQGWKGLKAEETRDGQKPLIATFGTRPIKTQRHVKLKDVIWQPTNLMKRTELAKRITADKCELCGGTTPPFEVHHVRKLADLSKKGRKMLWWEQIMSARKRKTLVVCLDCHRKIHNGTYDGIQVK